MIEYRTYNDNDFESVFHLLNENMDFDLIENSVLKEKLYSDPNWLPQNCYIAEDDSGMLGFMQTVFRDIQQEAIGYIKLLVVRKDERRKGIASYFLNQFESEAIKQNCKKIRIYDVPLNYFMPGIDPRYTPAVCFAENSGFVKFGEAINMDVDLDYSDWNADERIDELKVKDILISRASRKDFDSLRELVSEKWPLWKNELNMALKMNPPSVFIAKKKEKVLAFSAYDGNNVGTGWFGPMGTHENLRGMGIGGVLLYLCLSDMKTKGQKKAVIPWVGPVGFYANYANARISRVFWRYEKELSYE